MVFFNIIDNIFNSIVLLLKKHKLISTDILAVDSKPILAYTKHNNLKNPYRSLDKNYKPSSKRNSEATLSYYSAGASSLNNKSKSKNNQNSKTNSSMNKNKNYLKLALLIIINSAMAKNMAALSI